jgi:beta-lactamase class A
MITLSDNSATNMLIDVVGIDGVNEMIQSLGAPHTLLNKKVFKSPASNLPEERTRWGLGVTTPLDMLKILESLYRSDCIDRESSSEMIRILSKQRDIDQIPRLLVGEEWKNTRIAHKTGALSQVRNDVGIVFTPQGDYILSLFAQQSSDRKWTADNEASVALAQLARAVLQCLRSP